MGVSVPFNTLRNELAQTWLHFSLPGKSSSVFINLVCIEKWRLICLSLGPAAPSCLYSRQAWPQLFCYFERVITLKGFDLLLINPWAGFLPFPLTGSSTGSRVVSREATWREAGGRGWSCVNTTFAWICLCAKSTVSQDLSCVTAWIRGGNSKMRQAQNRGVNCACTRFPMQHLCCLLDLNAAAYSAMSHNCLNFLKMARRRTQFNMQNSSVYLFHELLPIFVSLYMFMRVILLHNTLV